MRTSCFVLEVVLLGLTIDGLSAAEAKPVPAVQAALPEIERLFDDYQIDARLPGLVYGIIADGRVQHLAARGVRDLESREPVTPDSVFRIASMTKAFIALSILHLRDEGKLRLDDRADLHVPEMRGWALATPDSPPITMRDLLHHTAGLVTDDPWADRQEDMSEEDFSRLLAAGVPFTRATGTAFEYSNLGYAVLGRIIGNAAGQPYAGQVASALLRPLGMSSSGFEITAVPAGQRTHGYRWEENQWKREPDLSHGAFGAIGGLCTSARDYARWVAFLLSAWPPGEADEKGPVARATVRELAQGNGFPRLHARFGRTQAEGPPFATIYGMGFHVGQDRDLGRVMFHGGGYPGYGSHLLLLPDAGVGIFAFANRTYSGPAGPVWDTALALRRHGALAVKPAAVTPELAAAYEVAGRVFESGDIQVATDAVAMNFFLDRSVEVWNAELARLKKETGACDIKSAITPTGRLSGQFEWRGTTGRVGGSLLLSPTQPPKIQALRLELVAP